MSLKLRILAIIALVIFCIGTIFMIMYFFDTTLLGGYVGGFALSFLGVGLVIYFIMYFAKIFPQQKAKQEEFKRLEEEYYKKLDAQESAKEQEPPKEQETPADIVSGT